MRNLLNKWHVQNPERIIYQMVDDYIKHRLDDNRALFRASVVEIDTVGGAFESNPQNPKNSIRARIITDSYNAVTIDEDLPVFWPLYSHDLEPLKEGEHVYIIFEDMARKHGLWISRTAQPLNVDSVNYVKGTKQYVENPDNNLTDINAEQAVAGISHPLASADISDDFTVEKVPPFTARVGDKVIQGSNNTIIVLGRDRPSTDSTIGQSGSAGTIDIVAGRQSNEEMDLVNDFSRIYISEKSDIDEILGTDTVGSNPSAPSACLVLKSDEIRVIARNGMKVVVESGDMTLEADNIFVGNKASHPAVWGDALKEYLTSFIRDLGASTIATSTGPTATISTAIGGQRSIQEYITNLSSDLDSVLSDSVTVK